MGSGRNVRRLAGTTLGAVLAFICLQPLAPSAGAACSMRGSQPHSGTLTLKYVRPSTRNADRNDYRLSGTIRWGSAAALACFAVGRIDWAYEHNLTYQKHFDRKIWSPDFSAFPSASSPYVDTTLSDFENLTDLSFGLFRPETLRAGVDYSFAYSLFLPRNPPGGFHSLFLEGQVLERWCSMAGPLCVNLPDSDSNGLPLIGTSRRFAVKGTTCWSWRAGKSPVLCPRPSAPAETPPAGTSPAPEAPASDGSPPATPASLKASAATSSITLAWAKASDDVGVAGYSLYRNGARIASSSATTYKFSGLSCGTSYTLGVDAYDAAGNRSGVASVRASTAACAKAVTVSKGARINVSGCKSIACAFVTVKLANFSAGSHTVTCYSDYPPPTGSYYQYSTSSMTSNVCVYGYLGTHVWVTVDGVESNHLTW